MAADLCVIMVNWRNEAETLRCIASLHDWAKLKPKLLVVDNESTEGSQRALASALSADELIVSTDNLGYAGGNNLGIKQALSAGASFILLLNSDATIAERDVSRLLDRLHEHPRLGVLGPVLRERGNSTEAFHIGGRDIAQHALTRAAVSQEPTARHPGGLLVDVDYVPGTVLLVRRSLFEQIGLLDEEYFFSGEIADFCKRVRDSGFRVCVDLEAEARHDSSEASQSLRDTLYVYYSLRNRMLYARRHHRSEPGKYLFWSKLCLAELGRSLARGHWRKARAILLAMADGATSRFGNRNDAFL